MVSECPASIQESQVNVKLLLIKKLSENATIPTKGSQFAAGFDLARYGNKIHQFYSTSNCWM